MLSLNTKQNLSSQGYVEKNSWARHPGNETDLNFISEQETFVWDHYIDFNNTNNGQVPKNYIGPKYNQTDNTLNSPLLMGGELGRVVHNYLWGRCVAALKAKPGEFLHYNINKTSELLNKNVYTVVQLNEAGNTFSTQNQIVMTIPRNKTVKNEVVVLARSNKISCIYVHQKNKRIYICGDFRYEVYDPQFQYENGDKLTFGKLVDKNNGYLRYIYENIICVDFAGYLDTTNFLPRYKYDNGREIDGGGVALDGDVNTIVSYDKVNQYNLLDNIGADPVNPRTDTKFYKQDDGTLFLGGAFTGYIKKIESNGKEYNNRFFSLNFTLNGPVYALEIDPFFNSYPTSTTLSMSNEFDIYIGGDFTSDSLSNNKYITRMTNRGNHKPITLIGGTSEINLNGAVKCIKIFKYHTSSNRRIIMIGGKFTTLDSTQITKCAKIYKNVIGAEAGNHEFDLTFRPIYDEDENSEVLDIEEYKNESYDYFLLGGKFTNAGEPTPTVSNFCRCLISDGTLDLNFLVGRKDPFILTQEQLGFNGKVTKIKIWELLMQNSKQEPFGNSYIFVGGTFNKYSDTDFLYFIVRLLNDEDYKLADSTRYYIPDEPRP